VLGITHAEFGPWGLRREYTLYDETAIWKQILLQDRTEARAARQGDPGPRDGNSASSATAS
jgi:hypothetical protein